ncbi:MAG: LuxR C-terminal-related transcriptional regulator [Trueperaceae bacterium]
MDNRASEAAEQHGRPRQARGEGRQAPNNLPVQATPLVGRQRELAILEPMLLRADVPLLTLTGTGGIGKTRLALRLAAQLADDFADGVFLVALAPLRDYKLVMTAIGGVLGIHEGARESPFERLVAYIRSRQLLLVLDNFEHLMPAAPKVAALLAACPYLKLLVTSRAPLRLTGEHEFPVAPLGVPQRDEVVGPEALEEYEALKLFRQRAQAVKPSFRLTAENATTVSDICRTLDGLPLAIELAAARTKLFDPDSLLARLEKRLEFLTGGARDLPERQQTLRKTIDWSHDLLSDTQRRLFRRMSVFDGQVGLRAVEAVCGAPGDLPDLLDDLTQLVDQSLVRQIDADCPLPCLDMLETIREYALEKLANTREEEQVREAHARFSLLWAEELETRAEFHEPEKRLKRLELEQNNFRAALRWALQARDAELSLRLAQVLAGLWENNAYLREGRRWLEEILALDVEGDELLARRADVCHHASLLATRQSDWPAAIRFAEESLGLYRAVSDRRGEAHALLTLALVATMRNEYAASVELHERVLPMFEALGDKPGLARALHNFGLAHRFENPREAVELGLRSLALYLECRQPRGAAQARNLIGWARLNLGEADEARASFEESLKESWRLQARWVAGYVLQGLSDAVLRQGNPVLAVKLSSVSEHLFRTVEVPMRQVRLEEHFDQLLRDLRAALGDDAFQCAWDEGQAIAVEEAIEELERFEPPGTVAASQRPVTAKVGLTPREREVLELVAEGLSDRQIAKRLGISPTTASKHVANMLGKTGSRNRVELTRLALKRE